MCAVEWKKLGDVCEVGTGSNNREDACDNGLYPFYVRSKDVLRINKYLFDEEAIIIPGEGGIGDIFHYANGKYGLHQRAYRVHPIDGEVVCKYLYYYLSDKFKQYIVSKSVGATATSIRKPMLEGFMLPIPSLAKQQEIVSQLDTFTTLISNLESELDMRRKQYEHYRNQLLDFEGVEGVEWKTLGDVCDVFDGTHQTPQYTDFGVKFVSVENINDPYSSKKYISLEDYDSKYKTKPIRNDVLMTRIGDVGTCYILDKNEPIAYYVSLALLRPNSDFVISGYIKDIIESRTGKGELRKRTLLTAVPLKINLGEISKIKIPIPSLSTQQEIVSKLDAFENLIQSLEQEIKLRKQQYEYYREKLLTFEKE